MHEQKQFINNIKSTAGLSAPKLPDRRIPRYQGPVSGFHASFSPFSHEIHGCLFTVSQPFSFGVFTFHEQVHFSRFMPIIQFKVSRPKKSTSRFHGQKRDISRFTSSSAPMSLQSRDIRFHSSRHHLLRCLSNREMFGFTVHGILCSDACPIKRCL